MSPILEFFTEITEVNTLYYLYTSIVLGLTIKYLWSINSEYVESTSFFNDRTELAFQAPSIILKIFRTQSDHVIRWIIRMVRRKQAGSDETDNSVPLFD